MLDSHCHHKYIMHGIVQCLLPIFGFILRRYVFFAAIFKCL